MTFYDFIAMDVMEQQKAWTGVHIAAKKDEEHNILLCQIDNFYVVVFFGSPRVILQQPCR